MRLNYIIPQGNSISNNDIHSAIQLFYDKHKVMPDSIKMSYSDMSSYMMMMYSNPQLLEKGKSYGLFLPVPGGVVELALLEEDNEAVVNLAGVKIIVAECSQIDREFEKHILNSEDK